MSNEWGFPGGLLVKNLLANLEDVGSITGSRSFPGEGCHSPSPGHLPEPGMKPMSPAWQANSLPLSHLGRPLYYSTVVF